MVTTIYAGAIISVVAAGITAKLIMDKDADLPLSVVWVMLGLGWGLLILATVIGGVQR